MILMALTAFEHRKISTQTVTDNKYFWINHKSSNILIVTSKYNEVKKISSHSNKSLMNYQTWIVIVILLSKLIITTQDPPESQLNIMIALLFWSHLAQLFDVPNTIQNIFCIKLWEW